MKKLLFFIIICLFLFLNFNCSEVSDREANDDDAVRLEAQLRGIVHQYRQNFDDIEAEHQEKVNRLQTNQPNETHGAETVIARKNCDCDIEKLEREKEWYAERTTSLEQTVCKKSAKIAALDKNIFDLENRQRTLQEENGAQRTQLATQDKKIANFVIDNKKQDKKITDFVGDNKKLEEFIIGSGIDFVVVSCLENRLSSAHEQFFNNRDFAAVISTVTGTVVKEVYYTHKGRGSKNNKERFIGGAVDVGCKFVGMKAVSTALFATNYASNFWNEKDCIDVEKHRGTIETVQTVAGNALIFCAGPSLKAKLNA